MKEHIRQFLQTELKSDKSKRVMHDHFYLLKDVKRNRVDFQFVNPNTNKRFGHFSVSCHGSKLKFHSNINKENFYQEAIFNMFTESAQNVIKQQERAIIRMINKNQIFF